jgi:hypothetical protein
MPRNSGEIGRFYRREFDVDFRTVRAADYFSVALVYLPFDGFHSNTQSPFTQSPMPPFAA